MTNCVKIKSEYGISGFFLFVLFVQKGRAKI